MRHPTGVCSWANAVSATYTADVIPLIEACGLSVHTYADDLQVYCHVDPTQSTNFWRGWLTALHAPLRLNPSKTELIWLGSPRRRQQCTTDGRSRRSSPPGEIVLCASQTHHIPCTQEFCMFLVTNNTVQIKITPKKMSTNNIKLHSSPQVNNVVANIKLLAHLIYR